MKRNPLWLRRFASLWAFLIVLEIACPILECENLEDLKSNATVDSQAYNLTDNYEELASATLVAQAIETGHNDDSSETYCNDECLCHVTGIPSLAFDLPKIYVKPLPSAVKTIDAPLLALPPPFQPPKTA